MLKTTFGLRLRAKFGPAPRAGPPGRARFSPTLALPSILLQFQLSKRPPNSPWQNPEKASRIGRPDSGRFPQEAGGWKIRLWDFSLPGEALAGLEVERSVSGISCSYKRRSPGWRLEDPSRGFLAPKKRRSPGWRWKDPSRGFLAPTGGGKIRLGDFLLPGEALTGLEVERSVSGISCSQKRRSLGWRRKDPSRR